MSEATARIDRDDDRVRVTTWTFPTAGASTGHHVHELDYVVVPITGGRLTVTGADGTRSERVQVAGEPYSGTAGTAHEVDEHQRRASGLRRGGAEGLTAHASVLRAGPLPRPPHAPTPMITDEVGAASASRRCLSGGDGL